MDEVDLSALSEDGVGGDVPDGDTGTVDFRRYPDIYLYNNVEPTSDMNASYHALSTAYDDLKKRFNELQTRHRVALRQIKRSSAPPDLNSPSSTYGSRLNDMTNGDVNSWSFRGSDNSTTQIEIQLCESQDENSRLKQQLRHQTAKVQDLEKRCTLLSERTQMISSMHTQQQNSLKQAQERHLVLEHENEDIRKQLVTRDKKLRELAILNDELNKDQCEHIAELEKKLFAIENEHKAQTEDRKTTDEITAQSLADALSFMKLEEGSAPHEAKEGEFSLSSDLEPLLHGMVCLQSEILQLNDMVAKQQGVIKMLKERIKGDPPLVARSLSHNNAEIRDHNLATGQGARPKIRGSSTNLPPPDSPLPSVRRSVQEQRIGDQSNSRVALRESGSESALTDIYTKDILRPRDRSINSEDTRLKDYVSPVNPFIGDVNAADFKDVRGGVPKRHSALDFQIQRSSQLQSGDPKKPSDGFKQNKRHTVSGVSFDQNSDPFEDIRRSAQTIDDHHPFDHLRFNVEIDSAPDTVFDSRDLPDLPAGFHRRHDSLEHLRDEVEQQEQTLNSDIIDVHSYDPTSGTGASDLFETGQDNSFNMRDLSDSEVTMTYTEKDNTQRVTTDGTVENRYRTTGPSGQQPRPIDIERNHCDNPNSSSRNYDNTSANVNLNYQGSGKLTTDSSAAYQVLNNNPLVGHKTIPSRNIYQGERTMEVADDGPDLERSLSQGLQSPAEGRVRQDSFLSRTCPVCEEDFGYTIPMEDFQHHVLDCLAVPNPTDHSTTNERVCPMCSEVFPHSVLQRDFERHVNEHFEEDTRSIVNEFEVVPPGTATTTS